MSKFREMIIDIQDEIERGELSYRQIAQAFNVSYDDVMTIAEKLQEYNSYEDNFMEYE